jgi:hypothetical protein
MSSKHPPKGNEHPGVMDLAKSTTHQVKPLGKEGGTISGKPGDRVNPWRDQDHNTGSVKPGAMPMMPNWMAVYGDDNDDNDHEKRKKAERRDTGEAQTNRFCCSMTSSLN